MKDALRACPLVQVVDVLRHQHEVIAPLGQFSFQAGQGDVSRIWPSLDQVAAARAAQAEDDPRRGSQA
jgi:hypothetical protein